MSSKLNMRTDADTERDIETIQAYTRRELFNGSRTMAVKYALNKVAQELRKEGTMYVITSDQFGSTETEHQSLKAAQVAIDSLYESNGWGEAPELDDNGEDIYYSEEGVRVYVGEVREQ